LEQAAIAVDELFNSSFQTSGKCLFGCFQDSFESPGAADDSGDESEEEEERRDEDRNEEEETEDSGDPDSPMQERAPSPEEEVVLSASNSHQEHLGPSEEEDAEFAKEFAKMVTDTSAESRKVDKKTALALWDNATLPPVVRKKRVDDHQERINSHEGEVGTMAFTLITKRGNKQNVRLRNTF
jgi:regulator of nonsense transcripts 2